VLPVKLFFPFRGIEKTMTRSLQSHAASGIPIPAVTMEDTLAAKEV
jgi:hypothetical protein